MLQRRTDRVEILSVLFTYRIVLRKMPSSTSFIFLRIDDQLIFLSPTSKASRRGTEPSVGGSSLYAHRCEHSICYNLKIPFAHYPTTSDRNSATLNTKSAPSASYSAYSERLYSQFITFDSDNERPTPPFVSGRQPVCTEPASTSEEDITKTI